jgi:uncharacterized membrane protein
MSTMPAPRQVTVQRPLGRALARRRRVSLSLLQLTYIGAAAVLGALLPRVQVGSVPTDKASQMLFAIAAGVLPLLGIVYSLLFLVVQWSHSMFTPRLNLFRDHPAVWHAFGFFTAVFVFAITAAFSLDDGAAASALVPFTATLLVLVAVGLFRILLTTAFSSIQLGATLRAVAGRGVQVIEGVYPQPFDPTAASTEPAGRLPPTRAEVYWPHLGATLQRIDVARLVQAAARTDCVVEFRVGVGQVVRQGRAVAAVHGNGPAALSPTEVVDCVVTGPERTFDQDPALAIRVLVDIALRALSPAINDPTSAVQALDAIHACLERLAGRDLDVARIAGVQGHERLRLVLPSWQEYVALAFDELLVAGPSALQVARRLVAVLGELADAIPSARRAPIEGRLERAAGALQQAFPDEAQAPP